MNGRALVGGALALLLVSVVPADAQEGRGGGGMGQMFQNPITFLLSQTDSIEFSEAQTTTLAALADSLDTANGALREEMAALRAGGGGREAFAPIMEKMQTTNDAWTEKAMAVLDEAQRPVAQRLLANRPARGRRGGGL